MAQPLMSFPALPHRWLCMVHALLLRVQKLFDRHTNTIEAMQRSSAARPESILQAWRMLKSGMLQVLGPAYPNTHFMDHAGKVTALACALACRVMLHHYSVQQIRR